MATPPRLAEVVASISLATDLGMGQPLEQALRTCLLAVALAEEAEVDAAELPAVYYTALLRYLGCTGDAHEASLFFGDEIAARAAYATIDPENAREALGWMRRHVDRDASAPKRGLLLGAALVEGRKGAREAISASCEVARRLAERLALPADVQRGLQESFERWDGRGYPAGLAGDGIALPARLVAIARDAEVFARVAGTDAAVEVVRGRAETAYDPRLADAFCRSAPRLLAALDEGQVWETALAAEPPPKRHLSEEQLDGACAAIADFADIKSPWTLSHSSGVAELAEAAAWRQGLPAEDVTALRRAALVHDLGRVGVPNSIWDHPGPLGPHEWERVRLHPYLTERVLAQSQALAPLARVAACHHERLDGSGYHRGCAAADQSTPARLLAAADVYHALGEPRAHRPAREDAEAARILRDEVSAGRLDPDAAEAVLQAAGHRDERIERPRPAGLTEREVEVLRLLARGNTNRAIARALSISVKTAGHHVEHIYEKAGCSTRAAASLFAVEHDLL